LSRWLREDREAERVAAILAALADHRPEQTREPLTAIIADKDHQAANRLAALRLLVGGLDAASEGRLLELLRGLEDGPVLAEAIQSAGRRAKLPAAPLLLGKLASSDAGVRAAAITALAELNASAARDPVVKLLQDRDANVRGAAAAAAGKLGVQPAR